MAYRTVSDEIFIESAIKIVAALGIENMRTKHVADYSGFSEVTMYKRFPSKDILLQDTFLEIDKRISNILTQSDFVRNPGKIPFDLGFYATWRKVYRYLIEHPEESIFLIRYRYSSHYTDEVRSVRQAYNGSFEKAYSVFENYYGESARAYREFLINYIFEMTLGFTEKIITGRIEDNQDTEYRTWLAISNAVGSWTQKQGALQANEKQRITETQQTGFAGTVNAAGTGK